MRYIGGVGVGEGRTRDAATWREVHVQRRMLKINFVFLLVQMLDSIHSWANSASCTSRNFARTSLKAKERSWNA